MRPEQLTWTDKEWALHLECDVHRVPAVKNFVTKHFFPAIAQHSETGKYYFYMSRLDVAPSGAERVMPMVSSDKEFESEDKAIKYANEEILPRLEFNKFAAQIMGMPTRALQMLHIKEKQK